MDTVIQGLLSVKIITTGVCTCMGTALFVNDIILCRDNNNNIIIIIIIMYMADPGSWLISDNNSVLVSFHVQ